MLRIDEVTARALEGSRSGDAVEIWAWYGGQLAWPDPLPVSSWSLAWDGSESKQVQGVLEVVVEDPTGRLAPWLWDDPLGVGGTELQVRYRVGGAGEIARGMYRITKNEPQESWYSRTVADSSSLGGDVVPAGSRLVMLSGGTSVPVTAEDLTVRLALDQFLMPEQPPAGATVIDEIYRLTDSARVPAWVTPEVPDIPVPAGVTYEGPKIDAIMDLAGRVGASVRMDGDGFLEVYVKDPAPVWVIAGGPDGALINVDRAQDVERLPNIGVVTGEEKFTDSEGQEQTRPLYGFASITEGPLSIHGPHGNIPRFLSSSLMNTQAAVDAAAQTLITNQVESLTLDLEVTCLPHPALQVGDWVTVTQPIVDGELVPLTGEVVSMSLASSGDSVGPMSLTVRCPYAAVTALRQKFRGL